MPLGGPCQLFGEPDVCFWTVRNVVGKHSSEPTFNGNVCMHACLCVCCSTWMEVRGQLVGVGSPSTM